MRSIIVAIALLASAHAHAATAFLTSCRVGTSVTGQLIYIGTYQYGGRYFERAFQQWCPVQVEVY